MFVHGEEGLNVARRAKAVLFGAEIEDLDDNVLSQIFADVPSRELARTRLEEDALTLIDALVETGLSKSKSEARKQRTV